MEILIDDEQKRLYLAGERVPAGCYQMVGTTREICLDSEDWLPASLDGHVACYILMPRTWRQMQQCGQRDTPDSKGSQDAGCSEDE